MFLANANELKFCTSVSHVKTEVLASRLQFFP